MGELRGVEAKLDVGPIWAERLWRRGSAVEVSSSEFERAAALFWSVGARREQKSEGIQFLGLL